MKIQLLDVHDCETMFPDQDSINDYLRYLVSSIHSSYSPSLMNVFLEDLRLTLFALSFLSHFSFMRVY